MKLLFISMLVVLDLAFARKLCFKKDDLETLSPCKDVKKSRRNLQAVCLDELASDRIKVSHKRIF